MELEKRNGTGSVPLPPYRAVLAVDAEKFSRNTDRSQQIIGQAIPEVLARAFHRSGMEQVWSEARFSRHSGDGYVIGMEPEYLPYLIHPFLDRLEDELRLLQPRLAFHDRELRLRLRAGIDVGPLPDTRGQSPVDAMGEAMIQVHRLLDAEPVKAELAGTDPNTTLLAVIVSRRVYEDAVLGGFGGVQSSRFRPVHVSLPTKAYTSEGYLYVPTPSMAAEASRSVEAAERKAAEPDSAVPTAQPPTAERPAPAPTVNKFSNTGSAENIVQTETFHGGINSSGRGNR
ncbi:hypothetical protein HDA32_001120 [Spinactinospora alkalitolerans]|uniref:Guanylate cyclase domain-containing protein n=1 Tax=Spinactinospora alkalitolerans TaxID=687207 RepID=A0A852TVT7_9ACTN|nr:hypothetical protein [Spinactinospora alkalitolerans]NYE46000.1 hypothetical protein [Spinactinospora alkalitolerans]